MSGFAIVTSAADGSILIVEQSAFTANQQSAILHMLSNVGHVTPSPFVQDIIAVPDGFDRNKAQRDARRTEAKLSGYTGNPCPSCQSPKTRHNGSCLLCEDCGATTGCS